MSIKRRSFTKGFKQQVVRKVQAGKSGLGRVLVLLPSLAPGQQTTFRCQDASTVEYDKRMYAFAAQTSENNKAEKQELKARETA